MRADFYNAFYRHSCDADYLYTAARWANADHLYGLSAECGLKCLMLSFGMSVDPSGTPMGKDKVHINKVWVRYETYRARNSAAGYNLPQQNPFDDWDVNQRYAHKANFDQARVDPHKNACIAVVKTLIEKAVLEGRITP